MLDVFSRYVVGWMVAHRESAMLATRFIAHSCGRQSIHPGQLTIHADRGSAMTSKPVALLLADLGVTKTHARPHVSNDNPFSEAQFELGQLALKSSSGTPDVWHLLGDIATHADDFDPESGEAHYRRALALAEPRGMRPLVAHCHLGLGKLYRRTGKGEQAQEHLTTAATMYREMGMTYWLERAEPKQKT